MKRAVAAALIATLIGSSLSGCSFAFVSGPPANHRQAPYFDCTSSRVVPVLDVIWSVLQTANFALAVSRNDAEWDDTFNGDPLLKRGTAIPVYAILAGLGIGGAAYGFAKTSSCRAAKAELQGRMMQGAGGGYGAPATWPPPGPSAPPPPPAAPMAPAPATP